jgi:hypothetical protein
MRALRFAGIGIQLIILRKVEKFSELRKNTAQVPLTFVTAVR